MGTYLQVLSASTIEVKAFHLHISEVLTSTLQIYAGSFFAIPLVRWFFVQKTNADIDKRNQARSKRSRALESPDLSLRQKVNTLKDLS